MKQHYTDEGADKNGCMGTATFQVYQATQQEQISKWSGLLG